ncbi:hypothetical protein KAF25_000824 [Fusarium avenaceum]|uniref:Ubiquitin-related modifier 1 n=1 Tax=Fusarium avenaceum TaxID=40199 RepID=A0A9P7KN74_9HYPO|nr:hypothetical protein KAF25_000824 [Fusarium avenaceum]
MAEPGSSPKLSIDVEFSIFLWVSSVECPPESTLEPCACISIPHSTPSLHSLWFLLLFSFFSSSWTNIVANSSGGLEMLFSNKRQHALVIPAADQDGKPANIANLIDHLCQNVMDDSRKDLFVLSNHLRPGILVLINDADWELEGEEAYEIQSGDNILFVSTLHGG